MTTPEPTMPVQQLRRMTAEFGTEFYTDAQMEEFLVRATSTQDIISMDRAALYVWLEKLARYATMVDVVESGSERKLSQLYKNAAAQVALYTKYVEAEVDRVTAEVALTRVPGRSSTIWGGVPVKDPVLYGSLGPRA